MPATAYGTMVVTGASALAFPRERPATQITTQPAESAHRPSRPGEAGTLGIMATMTSDPGSADERPLPRIGDAERQAAVDELSEHFVAGRLDDAEFNQRMDAALQARTLADLTPLFTDLPTLNATAPWAQGSSATPSSIPYVTPGSDYRPAVPHQPSASQLEPGWANALRTIRPIIWPVAIGLIIFTHIPAPILIFAAIILTILSNRALGAHRQRHGELPPGSGPRQLPPGSGPDRPGNGGGNGTGRG